MLGRIVQPVDFQRVLGRPPKARSVLFAIHHLPEAPMRRVSRAPTNEISTGSEQTCEQSVDDSGVGRALPVPPASPIEGAWLGMVVPKRHAKRSVTRSLVKRQIRAAFLQAGSALEGPVLPPGLWVVRLRSAIDRARFPSAASDALRALVRDELQGAWHQAVRRARGA